MTRARLLTAALTQLRFLLSLLLATGVAVASIGLVSPVSSENSPLVQPEAPASSQETGKKTERTDALGDPLPPGALIRLGSIRLKHSEQLAAAVFSPDGKLLASGGGDRPIRLWDPATGKELRQILGPEGGVNRLTFTPDSQHLAGAANDGNVYLYSVATGKEVRQFACLDAVNAIALSPAGNRLAANANGSIRLWDIASGKVLWTVEKGSQFGVTFSPDGRMVAAASFVKAEGWSVRIWDAESGKLLRQLVGGYSLVYAIAFSRDGKYLLGSCFRDTQCWEVATGKKRQEFAGVQGRGNEIAFSPDGKLLAIADNNRHIHIWNWDTAKVVLVIRRQGYSFGFSPDGKTLVFVSDSGAIRLCDIATGKSKFALTGHQEELSAVAYFPDGRTVATGSWDDTIRLWDAKTGKELRRLDVPADRGLPSVRHMIVSPDGKQVAAVGGSAAGVVLWDVATGKVVRRLEGICMAFSPDNKLIACGSRDSRDPESYEGVIHLYNRGTGYLWRVLRGHPAPVRSLAFTADGKTLLSLGSIGDSSQTRLVRIWVVATGKERRGFSEVKGEVGIFLSADGRTLASTALSGKTITLWETATSDKRATLDGYTDKVFHVALSPDGRTLAAAGRDGTVRLWDPFARKEIGRLEGHRGWVRAVAFAPDGKTLISGSLDTTALIWDVSRFTQRPSKGGAMTAAELQECYTDLRGDSLAGYRAVGRLVGTPAAAVALLRLCLKPAVLVDKEVIAQLVADLESKKFKTRDLATQALEKLGVRAAPMLEKALAGNPSLESKRRLEGLLEKLPEVELSAETLRQVRAVEVLEAIGTPEARAVLEGLAGSVVEVRQTREARGALARLKAR